MGLWSEGGWAGMLKTDTLMCLVPGGHGWKAGLSWHKCLSLFSPCVVSGLSICLHGSDLIHGCSGLPRAQTQGLPGPPGSGIGTLLLPSFG